MIYVYLETNFLLNLALRQESSHHSLYILRLAKGSKIKLVIPSYSLTEAYGTLFRRKLQDKALLDKNKKYLEQVGRNILKKRLYQQYKNLPIDIKLMSAWRLRRLDGKIRELLKLAETIEITEGIHQKGISYRKRLDLSDEIDAFIVASVESHIKNTRSDVEKIFITLDRASILNKPEVKKLFIRLKCKVFGDMQKARDYLTNVYKA